MPDDIKNLFEASKKELFFILGPCVLENRDMALQVAQSLAGMAGSLDIVSHFERLEEQDQDPACKVGQAPLQGQADGKSNSPNYGNK